MKGEEEIDSLDHINSLARPPSSTNYRANNNFNLHLAPPPTYLITTNRGSQLPSFGTSGRIIDPEFRPPNSQPQTQPQQHQHQTVQPHSNQSYVYSNRVIENSTPQTYAPSVGMNYYVHQPAFDIPLPPEQPTFSPYLNTNTVPNSAGSYNDSSNTIPFGSSSYIMPNIASTYPTEPSTNNNRPYSDTSMNSTTNFSNNHTNNSDGSGSSSTNAGATVNTDNISTTDNVDQVPSTSDISTSDAVTNAFTSISSATASSFSDLAKQQTSMAPGSDPIRNAYVGSTLDEYGPAIQTTQPTSGASTNTAQTTTSSNVAPTSTYSQAQGSGFSGAPPSVGPTPGTHDSHNLGLSYSTEDGDKTKPDGTKNTQEPSTTSNQSSSNNNPTTDIQTVPELVSSPPLDNLGNKSKSTASSNVPAQQNRTVPGKIPKISTHSESKFDGMNMLQLQRRFRDCEGEFKVNQNSLREIEKYLTNLTRSSHGKNIELDPSFRQKKDEQRKCEKLATDISSELKKINEILEIKYNVRMSTSQMRPPSKRAKMSTAAPSPREEPRDKPIIDLNIKKCLLELTDSRTWCQVCDQHFDSSTCFYEHLHQREHKRREENPTPWRVSKPNAYNKKKTYDSMKSICSKIQNELLTNFSPTNLAESLVPQNSGADLKKLILDRERGKFADEDPLFKIRGFQYLIPITGYYCSLCNCTVCDIEGAIEHMRGYEHNYAHAKSVALNPGQEKSFRTKMERSRKLRFPEEQRKLPPSVNDNISRVGPSTSRNNLDTAPPPPQQYKKPTSHIVDEHEAIIDKFPKQSKPTSAHIIRKRPTISEDSEDEDIRQTINNVKEKDNVKEKLTTQIIPLGNKSKPSALKQLRKEWVKKPSSQIVQDPIVNLEPIDEGSTSPQSQSATPERIEDDQNGFISVGQDDEEFQLPAGDPESPFPSLHLRLTSNMHLDVLKDKRLAAPCKVVLNKIDLKDYELLDNSSLWQRLFALVAKRESPKKPVDDVRKASNLTEAVFFDAKGGEIPIDVTNPPDKIDKKPTIFPLAREESDNQNNKTEVLPANKKLFGDEDSASSSEPELFKTGEKSTHRVGIGFLHDFFSGDDK